MAARRMKTLDISRGSADDCSITTNDWIWCFKRLVDDMDQTFYAVIRIQRVWLFGVLFMFVVFTIK